jgi:hypothetical protein
MQDLTPILRDLLLFTCARPDPYLAVTLTSLCRVVKDVAMQDLTPNLQVARVDED